jgi:pimeloyl-ACP methyl ester carboxylesterase
MSGMLFDSIFEDPRWSNLFYLVRRFYHCETNNICQPQVRYDLRAHGRSGKPYEDEAYTSKCLAENFDTVVQAFELVKPFVAGWYDYCLHQSNC